MEDDRVCQFYANLINTGKYEASTAEPNARPWTGAYAEALARSHQNYIANGAKQFNDSDKELLASLPITHFEIIECAQEESPFHGPIAILVLFSAAILLLI